MYALYVPGMNNLLRILRVFHNLLLHTLLHIEIQKFLPGNRSKNNIQMTTWVSKFSFPDWSTQNEN